MSDSPQPASFLPLTPVQFEILLVLTEGESHGYRMIKEVEERSNGSIRVATGTLYRALRRLTSSGLVVPAGRRPSSDAEFERRRYYAITPLGKDVAAAEARRLAAQVEAARARALLSGAEGEGGIG